MNHFFQLEKTVSAPGSTRTETVKNFYEEEKAVSWLESKGYAKVADRWENKRDQEPRDMFDVWVYIKIIKQEIQ